MTQHADTSQPDALPPPPWERPTTPLNLDPRLGKLTPAHEIVAFELANGATHDDAAKAASVHRVTVTRWANHHPGVRAAVNRHLQDRLATRSARQDRISAKALDRIEEMIDDGDFAAVTLWLKVQPPVPVAAPTSVTPEAVVIDMIRDDMTGRLDVVYGSIGDEHDVEEVWDRVQADLLSNLGTDDCAPLDDPADHAAASHNGDAEDSHPLVEVELPTPVSPDDSDATSVANDAQSTQLRLDDVGEVT